MTFIREGIRDITQFDEPDLLLFQQALTGRQIGKGQFLMQPGDTCRHIHFLQTGLLRSFYLKEEEERTIAFSLENSFCTDLKSLRSGQPSEIAIQALEPSVLLSISKSDLIRLYQQSHQIEAFGRRLLETLLEEQEEYLSWFRLYSAKERYDFMLQKHPGLLQRISLGQLASYLGIRRETLSRIRGLRS
ncbi:Crp/Fnr family transcriptional regulator [Dyadobacter sp. CY343]|uniref:Crp/Fnr family transcriptional regulator n=1 Tax=Dyadobacter sp. CY343 TaxID=2907299 RepID=UPI001F47F9DE|nr:Crp/Fnr family transcriptional regulator [Dyadobacter sp. CY343]MCE7062272.1 Crp/Fnr family transcriptional regulator [Dyadobacter sp. CY343]